MHVALTELFYHVLLQFRYIPLSRSIKNAIFRLNITHSVENFYKSIYR